MEKDPVRDVIVPVILAGGAGTRLWPLSRGGYPKQFLALAGEGTMFQDALARVSGERFAPPLVVCNEDHRFIVAEQMKDAGCKPAAIVLEPAGRNTAPAAACAALWLQEQGEDPLMLIMASDHVVANREAFLAAIDHAAPAARAGSLVTFGITPSRPETGYGYIRTGAALNGHDGVLAVDRFVEKPDLETAKDYLASGSYLWNSGIFLFSAKTYIAELGRENLSMLDTCRGAMEAGRWDSLFFRPDADKFAVLPSDSIDYAVMEKTMSAAVVPVEMGWNDLGTWSAAWDIGAKDGGNNVTKGDIVLDDAHGCYALATHRLVAISDLSDVVVVETDDAVLVADRKNVQNVKRVVERLKETGREECYLHSTVHRPWGSYRSIDRGDRFQVKRIIVQPGGRLSLQKHYHRAEHWVVVSGVALVTRGDQTFQLNENESTFIRPGELHRLSNPGKIPLHLIEVQSGGYLGEDDIVRFEDGYGRETLPPGSSDGR